ncbi:MAG: DUF4862 family protein [Elusimicrobiota bacterium]|nr:DUF4862 family protein [Elusimicrobiota bacterium]
MRVHLGAYAASPCHSTWDPAAETAYYEGLKRLDLAGLEHPYWDRLHRFDDAWFLDNLHPDWTLVLTTLPGTMDRLKDDPVYGLASADAGGRGRALDALEGARRVVAQLHRFLGRRVVKAVEVHSAPRLGAGAKSSLEAFADSLSSLRARDWDGATLLVEHCDAFVPSHAPDKGFLRIEDEALAVRMSNGATPAALAVNWGRSAVETRSAQGPLEHLRRAREAELLGGLFFSGATPSHPLYGDWRDSHAPFSVVTPESILTKENAAAALAQAGEPPFLGLKMQALPKDLGVTQRLEFVKTNLETLRSCQTRA